MDGPPTRLADIPIALLLASPMDSKGEAVCFEHLTSGERWPRNVMNVLFTRRPSLRIENWERHVGEPPERFIVLSSQRPSGRPSAADVETLGPPGDLTGIGVAIAERLSEWSTAEPSAFCLHSVTAQLQYADLEQVYQFLHTLRGHLTEREVVGHVHMNPRAHDDQTVDTFKTLFDGVVEVDDGGTTVVTS